MADIMEIEVLETGVLKITTNKVSMANHTNAEGLIRELVKGAGGQSNRVRKGLATHTHSHTHLQEN